MKQSTFAAILFFVSLAFVSGCSRYSIKPVNSKCDELNARLETLRDLRQYKGANLLIDSVRKTGEVSEAWVNGESGCISFLQNQLQEADSLLVLALNDKDLKRKEYQSYLTIAEYMVSNLLALHKWEDALRLAQEICQETRNSQSTFELLAAIRMYAYISHCQVRLHNYEEAQTASENVYYACLNYEKEDAKASRETFYCSLTIAEAYNSSNRWAEAEKWVGRTMDALRRVDVISSDSIELDYWTGYLNSLRCVALYYLGRTEESAEAFKIFQNSEFNQGLGGLNAIFYLTATEQWKKVEAMLPKVDSLIADMGAEIVPEYLEDRYGYQYLVYRKLGKTDKVLEVTDSVFKYFRTSVDNERVSKALDLAKLYETREKDTALMEKDRQLAIIWTGSVAGIMFLLIIGLTLFVINRRRSERRLMEEHQKLADAYDQLKIANARAEESAKMKNSFIRQISHEIRTPLNILSGFSQVLTNPNLRMDEETKVEANRSIVTNTQRITKLVNKMLELSDISSKAVLEREDKVLAGDIAMRAIADAGIQEIPSVSFNFEADEDTTNCLLQTNLRAAVRSLVLLLNNSHKFLGKPNQPQTGRVALRLKKDDANRQFNFIVEDTGVGVPAEESEHIFEEFVQLNDFYDGTGIGLTVGRSLTRRIGGDIILDTTYEGGARFVMMLPVESENQEKAS